MADYVGFYPNEDNNKPFTAGGTITGGDVVVLSAGGTAQSNGTVQTASGASNLVVGIAAFDAVAGQRLTVCGGGGTVQECISSAAIALGPVKSAASGRIAQFTDGTDAPGQLIGIALSTAAGAGTGVRVLWLR